MNGARIWDLAAAEYKAIGEPMPDLLPFGVRSTDPTAGVCNDRLGMIRRGGHTVQNGQPVRIGYSTLWCWGSTDPTYKGTAILRAGLYPRLWTLGKHSGNRKPEDRYEALVQRGETPAVVWRDRDHDNVREIGGEKESGWFGINFHYAGWDPFDVSAKMYPRGAQLPSNSTLGCQVLGDPAVYRACMGWARAATMEFFPCFLLSEELYDAA